MAPDRTWPILLYVAAILALVGTMLFLSWLLGERHRRPEPGAFEPYESGIVSLGSARVRFEPHFYLVAILFVVFDLEAMFLFAWAVAVREAGWQGYVDVLIFVGVLLIGLAYLWRVGVLDFVGRGRIPRHATERRSEVRPGVEGLQRDGEAITMSDWGESARRTSRR